MLTNFKINSALVICLAFIFRVLFVNGSIISSLTSEQYQPQVKNGLSSDFKNQVLAQTPSSTITSENSPMDVCEEDSNEENEVKSTSFFLIQILFSFASNNLTSQLAKSTGFSQYAPYTSSDKLLAFQVFKI